MRAAVSLVTTLDVACLGMLSCAKDFVVDADEHVVAHGPNAPEHVHERTTEALLLVTWSETTAHGQMQHQNLDCTT